MKSLEELAAIRDKMKQTVNTREAAHDWSAWPPAASPQARALC